MDRLKATAHITANSSAQEQRFVEQFGAMQGVKNVESTSHGSTFEVTADAPCDPPRTCGETIFQARGITNVVHCSGCTRG